MPRALPRRIARHLAAYFPAPADAERAQRRIHDAAAAWDGEIVESQVMPVKGARVGSRGPAWTVRWTIGTIAVGAAALGAAAMLTRASAAAALIITTPIVMLALWGLWFWSLRRGAHARTQRGGTVLRLVVRGSSADDLRAALLHEGALRVERSRP
ncbi:MAG: hypothetical protein AB7S26_33110 [Sandaracinaceae bacterium]